jgi:hypothetical protein
MGTTRMGRYDFSSWTLHMASISIFGTLWGIALHVETMRKRLSAETKTMINEIGAISAEDGTQNQPG